MCIRLSKQIISNFDNVITKINVSTDKCIQSRLQPSTQSLILYFVLILNFLLCQIVYGYLFVSIGIYSVYLRIHHNLVCNMIYTIIYDFLATGELLVDAGLINKAEINFIMHYLLRV